jgi:hypothetical protein
MPNPKFCVKEEDIYSVAPKTTEAETTQITEDLEKLKMTKEISEKYLTADTSSPNEEEKVPEIHVDNDGETPIEFNDTANQFDIDI